MKELLHMDEKDVVVHENPDGKHLPPILLAHLGEDPNKPTLLVYGHLDVQPAADPENWNHQDDPFELTRMPIEGGEYEEIKYYARGSTDDKGPVLAWINVIEAYQEKQMTIPVNLKVDIDRGVYLQYFSLLYDLQLYSIQ